MTPHTPHTPPTPPTHHTPSRTSPKTAAEHATATHAEPDPQAVARLMAIEPDHDPVWDGMDAAYIYEHQLNSPLLPDLQMCETVHMRQIDCGVDQAVNEAGLTSKQTYADVIFASDVSLPLLQTIKELAKRWRNAEGVMYPRDVASGLYYVAVACALVKRNEAISSFDLATIREGLVWLQEQNWGHAPTDALVAAALDQIDQSLNG